MLILTEAAAVAVKSVTSTSQASEGAGLRIASSVPQPRDPSSLQVSPETGPEQGDQVIEAAGARVFVEPQAAAYLDDKVLDAKIDAEGTARFSLGVQPAGQA
jgi:Fe-S cluster assembly iron-binding protein IscA